MNCLASHEKETLSDHCSIPTFVTTKLIFIFYFESRKNWLFIILTIVLYTLRHIALLWIQMIVIVLFFSLSFYLRNIYPQTYQLCLRLKYQEGGYSILCWNIFPNKPYKEFKCTLVNPVLYWLCRISENAGLLPGYT